MANKTISNTFVVNTVDDPVGLVAQYCATATPTQSSQIHTSFQTGDLYMRTRTTEETFSGYVDPNHPWNKIVGESGGETNYQFAISANKVSQDGTSATAPTDILSSDWQDTPLIVTTAKPYLWSKVQKKDGNGNNVGNPSYMRLTGEESIEYSVEGALNTIKVGAGQTSTLVSCTYTFYQKPAVSSTRSTVSCYYAVYLRSGNTFSLLTMSTGYNNHGSGTSVSVNSNVPYKSGSVVYNAVVIYIFPSSYYSTSPESQNYMAKKEIPIVKDGDTAFVVDLENEMTNVALDEDGKLTSALDMYFKVRAYYGTTNVLSDSACSVSASCSDSDVTLSTTYAKTTGIRVQISDGTAMADTTEISVTVTHTTYGTRTVIFTLAGVRGGENAVLQELLPSLDAISFARTTAGGLTPSSRDLTLSIKKTQGGSTSTQSISDSGLTIRWSSTSMPASKTGGNGWGNGTATGISWNNTTMQIANTVSATNIYIAAFNSAGTLVDRETIPIIKDGEHGDAAPYYFQEWFAWSNDQSTSSVITPPTISGSWATSIPAQGSYAYLWRKSIRYVWNESTRQYIGETAQYVRMTGTNGTSINIRGQVANTSSRGNGTATIITDSGTQTITLSDGDAVTQLDNGHLYQWVTEGGGKWLDLGQFKGESGKTYYTHIAWATNVNYNSSGVVTRVDGFTIDKSPNDTTHLWMGVLVNEDSGTDSSAALDYTWSYTKGVDGFSVQAQYAPNNNPSSSQIHNTWQNGDIYMRTKQSNETTWSSWNKIVGENGGETDYSFNISKEKTSASATDAPSNCYYNTWQDAPISPTSTYPYLWMKIQKKDGDGNNVGDASYARVTGELGIDYEIRCAIDSIKIPKDTTSTSVSTTFNFYYKESGKTPIAYNAYYGIYYRIGTTYTLISSGSGSYKSLSSYTVQSNQTAIVVFIFSASYSGNSPMSQSYLSKLELPIYKDGDKGDKGDNGDDAKYIYIRGTGYNNDAQRILNITSTTNVFSEYGSRGFVAARINRSTLAVSGITWFDVYGGLSEGSWTESDANANTARTRFVTYLTNTTSDYFLAVASKDAIGFNDAMVVKLREFGLGELDYTAVSGVGGFRTPFAFLGYKGLQQGYALYQLHGEGENEPYAEVMAYVSNGIFMSSKDGKDGARGKVGRFFYFGGTFNPQDNDPTHVFVVNDAQAPYFEHTENGQKRYHVFNYETNGSYTMSQMWAISNNWNNKPWEVMTNDFKYIITEALFGAYAHLGSFIINGDWMISQYGVLVDSSGTETIVDGGGANPIVLYGNDVHGGTIIVRVQFTTSGTASITATASCESTYDKGYVKNSGGSTLIEASGTQSDTVNQSVSSGGYIDLSYTKDSSVSRNDDKITFNISGVGYTLSLVSATSGMTYTGSSSSGGVIPSNPHTYFDPTDPMASTKPSSGYKFRPNFAVDGLTGKTYQQNAHIKGTVTATSGSFTNGTFTNATISSGSIGGFTIDTDRLYNSNWNAGIDINYDSKTVKIGKNAQGVMNTEDAIIRAENTKTKSTTSDTYNTSLYLNAAGAKYNYAFYGSGNGVLNGFMQGYKVHVLTLIGAATYLNLNNGQVQAIASVGTDSDKIVYLPTLENCRNTLGISVNDNTANFSCCITIINQSAIQNTTYNRDNVYVRGGSQAYTDEITTLSTRPVVLAQGNPKSLNITNCTTCYVVITYINKRFIANYITTTW